MWLSYILDVKKILIPTQKCHWDRTLIRGIFLWSNDDYTQGSYTHLMSL